MSIAERLRSLRRAGAGDWLAVGVALVAAAPVWLVEHVPLQDLPFHLATIRIFTSYADPHLGFAEHFVFSWGKTQYLAYYLLATPLAHVCGVVNANRLLLSVYLTGTPLAVRSLLRSAGRDSSVGLLVVPLLYNVMFLYGLLPFLFGIPIMFWALSVGLRHIGAPTRTTGLALAGLCTLLFFSHLFPFALFVFGFGILAVDATNWRNLARRCWPVLPALGLAALWFCLTQAGRAVTDGGERTPVAKPLAEAFAYFWVWLGDVFRDQTDEIMVLLCGALAATAAGVAIRQRSAKGDRLSRLVMVPMACLAAYLTLPPAIGPYWLIAQRFPILAAFTTIPIVRFPTGWQRRIFALASMALAVTASINTTLHFRSVERSELGDLEPAIDQIPPAQRVAALIYARESAILQLSPFLHVGSYYQAQKGGVVQFSYIGYRHWPVDYRSGHYPPPGTAAPAGWEWTPYNVTAEDLVPYYDYVLTRGEGFAPEGSSYARTYAGARWSVWKRTAQR